MQTVIIVIHLLIVIAMVGVVLMQRSEGGGLGIGGGSGLMSARGAANALTRMTAILGATFFATSLALSLFARYQASPTDIFDRLPQQQTQPGGGAGILDQLGGSDAPSAPAGEQAPAEQPSAPAPAEQSAPAPVEPQQPAEPQVPTGQ